MRSWNTEVGAGFMHLHQKQGTHYDRTKRRSVIPRPTRERAGTIENTASTRWMCFSFSCTILQIHTSHLYPLKLLKLWYQNLDLKSLPLYWGHMWVDLMCLKSRWDVRTGRVAKVYGGGGVRNVMSSPDFTLSGGSKPGPGLLALASASPPYKRGRGFTTGQKNTC